MSDHAMQIEPRFDVDDIEQALELAPALHHWFSELVGKPSTGAMSINLWWDKFRRLSSPIVDPEMVLAGRADAAAALLRVLEADAEVVPGSVEVRW